ncbi:AAA family ATPase [Streptomyces sp. 796.1]|uniref:AAA family ATPase n=1 Tax=Streptomyces sp. 796.1 TaxID=3163029 RepID=UPI0039C94350
MGEGPAPDPWWVFRGPATLPPPPPWRRFSTNRRTGSPPPYLMGHDEIAVVNAALHLHRPLLVTGRPGTGKSELAHAIARELHLGPVLRWSVNSRATLADALYRYDAVGRLREASLRRERARSAAVWRGPRRGNGPRGKGASARALRGAQGGAQPSPHAARRPPVAPPAVEPDIGQYLRLGPLGTALAAAHRPRVLLIDELDKADIDLPNDLLVVLEEGRFEIPELARLPEQQQDVDVMVSGGRERARVRRGVVSCTHFPIVVMTSNGERDFSPAFLRRCVRLDLPDPDADRLRDIVRGSLGEAGLAEADDLIETFLRRSATETLATDQLLAAVHLRLAGADMSRDQLLAAVLHRLDETLPT